MWKVAEKIGQKPIIVFIHGRSLEITENRIEELAKFNVSYVTLHQFDLMQQFILDKINKSFDSIAMLSAPAVPYMAKEAVEYVKIHNSILIGALANKEHYLEVENNVDYADSYNWPFSVQRAKGSLDALLECLVLGIPENPIFLLGADGTDPDKPAPPTELYWKCDLMAKHEYRKYINEPESVRYGACDDASRGNITNFNRDMKDVVERLSPGRDIYIVNPDSHYTGFPKITWEEMITCLS